jgi:hypothetical protein
MVEGREQEVAALTGIEQEHWREQEVAARRHTRERAGVEVEEE